MLKLSMFEPNDSNIVKNYLPHPLEINVYDFHNLNKSITTMHLIIHKKILSINNRHNK